MSLFSTEKVSEVNRFWREAAPLPGRMQASLRFALMSALATLLLLILQPPVGFIAPSLFMLFLVSHDTPYECFKGLLTCLTAAALGTTVILLLIIATGDHPVARVAGLAVCTFVAAFFFRTSVIPVLPMGFGCITYMVISLWEYQIRAEKILHLSLWPMGTLLTVAGSAMAVEWLFNHSDPLAALRDELKARCAALESLFELCAAHAEPERIEKQAAVVRRYAVTGVGRLHVLLERVSEDGECEEAQFRRLKALLLSLDRLLILSAGFTADDDPKTVNPARFERIRRAIAAARENRLAEVRNILNDSRTAEFSALDRIEQTLNRLGDSGEASAAEVATEAAQPAPSGRSWRDSLNRLLVPDALTNYDHFAYALKISVCATICYVIYNALGWPGISTSFFTVYFTGLSTTGTTNRKLVYRIIGSTIGGMIVGIGCLVFVFPNVEGVQGFLLVIAAVSGLGAWLAVSPYFGYLGLQIAFSFNLLAFERLRAPDQMTPARDRLLGITLGFLVMFFIFHQVRPERTVDTMRRLLARVLRAHAELLRLFDMERNAANIARIRQQTEPMVANLQLFAHAVKYEFPPDRAPDMRLSNEILNAAASARHLLLAVGTWPPDLEGNQETQRLREMRNELELGVRDLARMLEQDPQTQGDSPMIEPAPPQLQTVLPICAGKAIEHFRELQMGCHGIVRSAA